MKLILIILHVKEGLIVDYDELYNVGYGIEHYSMPMQLVPVNH